MGDGVPIAEWTGELLMMCKVKTKSWSRSESESDKGDIVHCGRRETRWSSHDQVEVWVKPNGGPNRLMLKN